MFQHKMIQKLVIFLKILFHTIESIECANFFFNKRCNLFHVRKAVTVKTSFIACKQALRMGHSEICFRIAGEGGGGGGGPRESLQ